MFCDPPAGHHAGLDPVTQSASRHISGAVGRPEKRETIAQRLTLAETAGLRDHRRRWHERRAQHAPRDRGLDLAAQYDLPPPEAVDHGGRDIAARQHQAADKAALRQGFYGQEINLTTYSLARINMFLHDVNYEKFHLATATR